MKDDAFVFVGKIIITVGVCAMALTLTVCAGLIINDPEPAALVRDVIMWR